VLAQDGQNALAVQDFYFGIGQADG
jgi:hypothetical protein